MRTTADIANAIVARLEAMLYMQANGMGSTAMFQEVVRFSSTNLDEAFRRLLLAKARVALVVVTGREWAIEQEGPVHSLRRSTLVSVLVSDRVVGNSQQAWAGSDSSPGAWGLADRVSPLLAGRLLPAPDAVDLLPLNEQDIEVTQDNQPHPGRAAVVLEFVARGGWIHAPTNPGPSY